MYPTVHENTSPAVCRKKNSLLHSVLIIAGLLLAALLLGGCKVGSLVRYRNADKYETGNFKYKASDVSKVEINWISGDIEVRQGRGSTLSAEESGGSLKESQKLRWRLDGDRLVLQYCKSGYRGRIPSKAKRLTIEVPEEADLLINSVSGDIEADDGKELGKLDIKTVSGDARLRIDRCGRTEINTVSGDFDLAFEETDGFSINSVSGDVSLSSLPKDGAEITFKKVSGDLLTQKAFEKDGSTYVFGGGGTRIDVKTVSGDLRVG